MKKIILFSFCLITYQAFSQVETLPLVNAGLVYKPARVTSSGSNHLGIGVGGDIQYFLNNSGTKNTGLGTLFNTTLTTESYLTDGKLHIRHNSTISNDTGTDGPQLILDEDQANDYARMRFRQSAISGFTYTRGNRYWDLAGFANGANTTQDFFNIHNSGTGDVLSVRGDGNTTIAGFTKLGSSAPAIKTKSLIGTFSTSNSASVLHGLNASKILSISVIQDNQGLGVFEQLNTLYTAFNSSNILLQNGVVNGAAYKIFITYEE
jgi:hypothetical protein